MKRLMIINYWLVIIGWCMLLNGYDLMAEILVVLSSLVMLRSRKINYIHMILTSLITSAILLTILRYSTIPYFFPKMPIYLLLISINCCLCNEYLFKLKEDFTLSVILVDIFSFSFISFLIIIIPDEYYEIIGKMNLMLINIFIFLPYLIFLLICVIKKALFKKHNTYIRNNELLL